MSLRCVFCRRKDVEIDPRASAKIGKDVCKDCAKDL